MFVSTAEHARENKVETFNGIVTKTILSPVAVLVWCFLVLAVALSPSARAAKTVKLTDMAGRTVRVPREIRRVVPLAGALRFMVYLQSIDLVTGVEAVERKWTSPGRLYGLATAEKARILPVIGEGGPGKLPDSEQIISVWPDIIVAMGLNIAQVETIQLKTGLPVFVLSYGSPGALDLRSAREAIRLLGLLFDRGERAEKVLAYMTRMDRDLATRTATVADDKRPSVYIGALSFKGAHGITSTEPRHAPLAWVKGRNVADEIDRDGHFFIDPEKLLFWNPDIIFLDASNLSTVEEDYRKNPAFYHRLKAVQEGRVFLTMPYNYYHTNIEIAYADAYFMGKILYPKQFADIDPAAKADEIFKFFTGIAAYAPLKKELHGFSNVRFGNNGLVVR